MDFTLQEIGPALHNQRWTYAKNYPWIPHYWVTPKQWVVHRQGPGTGLTLLDACRFISFHGERMLWGKSSPAIRRYLDWDGYRYWHCDQDWFYKEICKDGLPDLETQKLWGASVQLINRQKLHLSKCKRLSPDLKMPKKFEDVTLDNPRPCRAPDPDAPVQASPLG